MMSSILVILAALLYLGAGVDLLFKSNIPMATVFLAYALANVGLYYAQ